VCSSCGKTGHLAANSYLKDKKDFRVNKLGSEARKAQPNFKDLEKAILGATIVEKWATWPEIIKKPRHTKRNTPLAETGVEGRPLDRVNPCIGSVNTIGSKNGTTTECVCMQSDISNGKRVAAPGEHRCRRTPAKAR
jgi:hypothetical protein